MREKTNENRIFDLMFLWKYIVKTTAIWNEKPVKNTPYFPVIVGRTLIDFPANFQIDFSNQRTFVILY